MDMSMLGWAEIDPSGEFIAGSYVTLTLKIHVGEFGIDDGGSIRIARRSVSDSEDYQFTDPLASGYTTISTDRDARLSYTWNRRGHIRPWSGALQIRVTDGSLYPGDTVTVVIGDTSGGGPGFRLQTFREVEHIFKVLVDCFGSGRFDEIEASPVITLIGGPADELTIVTPSEAVVGEPFPILVRAIDSWGNRSDGYNDTISLASSDPKAKFPDDYIFEAAEKGAKRLQSTVLKTLGPQTITVRDGSGRKATSNTIIVREKKPGLSLYWGDFHGQTKETVATGSLDEYFSFARDVGGVDFAAWQGNDFQVTRELWNRVTEKVKEYHEPGKFVTFLGYEWSGLTPGSSTGATTGSSMTGARSPRTATPSPGSGRPSEGERTSSLWPT
jgi:hypothetical protein